MSPVPEKKQGRAGTSMRKRRGVLLEGREVLPMMERVGVVESDEGERRTEVTIMWGTA